MTLKNKTVLITGAEGFIGSHLTEALVKEGAKIKALSYYNSIDCRYLKMFIFNL